MADIELREARTTARTAAYLSITDRAVRRLCSEGKLSAYKVRGKTAEEWRVYSDSAEAYLQRKRGADVSANVLAMSDRAGPEAMLSVVSELTDTMKELITELRLHRAPVEKPTKRPWYKRLWQHKGDPE